MRVILVSRSVHLKSQGFIVIQNESYFVLAHQVELGWGDVFYRFSVGSGHHGKRCDCDETVEDVLVHF